MNAFSRKFKKTQCADPSNIRLETVGCPFGHRSPPERVLSGKDQLLSLPGIFTVVQCPDCGIMWTSPRPTQETIGYYYPSDYGPHQGAKISSQGEKAGSRFGFSYLLKSLIRFSDQPIPDIPPGRMLEIGCASGSFLNKLQSLGWQCQGIETSAAAARRAQKLGFPVHVGPVETAPDPADPLDLIVGWMVLEHLHAPLEALIKLYHWSRPGAWLALSVPNAGSLEFRIFKQFWYALQLPNHLYHFTPRTLSMMLTQAGWGEIRIFHQRILTNGIGSLGIWLKEKKRFKTIAQKLIEFPQTVRFSSYGLYPLALLAAFFGQTGRMTVWARRADG